MKTEEFRKKDISELEKMVYDLRKKLSDARFKFSANQVKNVKEVSVMKKDIARILTIIKETKNHA
jgi:large subunit ribosomal protein L29